MRCCSVYEALHVGRQRRLEVEHGTVGMAQPQLPGMQTLSWKAGSGAHEVGRPLFVPLQKHPVGLPVHLVAQDWMPDVFEVDADLMRAASVQGALDEGVVFETPTVGTVRAGRPSTVTPRRRRISVSSRSPMGARTSCFPVHRASNEREVFSGARCAPGAGL